MRAPAKSCESSLQRRRDKPRVVRWPCLEEDSLRSGRHCGFQFNGFNLRAQVMFFQVCYDVLALALWLRNLKSSVENKKRTLCAKCDCTAGLGNPPFLLSM